MCVCDQRFMQLNEEAWQCGMEAAMTAGSAQLDDISSLEEEQRTTTSLRFWLTLARVILKKTTLLSLQRVVNKSGQHVAKVTDRKQFSLFVFQTHFVLCNQILSFIN